MALTARGRFANSYDFLVAIAAFAVAPFVFRLPYIIFVHGGAYEFIVFTLILAVFVTVPLTSIELSIGHITGLSPTAAFAAISPRLRWVGWAQAGVCAILLAKVSADAARYLAMTVMSFSDLNWWTGCGNEWNSIDCESISNIYDCLIRNGDYHAPRFSAERAVCQLPGGPSISLSRSNATASSVRSHVVFGGLQFASHFLVDRTVNWPLTGALAVVWLLVLAVTVCGPRRIGKALYPLVFIPILLLLIVNIGIRTVDTLPYPAKIRAEDNSLTYLFTPDIRPAFSLYFFVQSLTFVSAGFGVYTVLASFHKQSETTTEQLTPRWKIALAAPWVAIGAILLNVLLISLVQFKVTRYASEIASMDFFNQFFEEDLFLALPSVAALLGAGQLWCVLFYLGLFLLCLGTAIPMFLTIVACVVDDVRAFNNKGVLATILLALAMLAVSLASLFTIDHIVQDLGFSLAYLAIILFVIAVALFYGWYELQKDTQLALGEPQQPNLLITLLMPSSQYHTGFLLVICPLFVGLALTNTPLLYFYQLFSSNHAFDSNQIVGTLISLLFIVFLIGVAIMAVLDCDRHLSYLPYVCTLFPRTIPWTPLRSTVERHQSYPAPLGNSYLLWLLCDYNTALIVAFFLEMLSTLVGFGLAILYANDFSHHYVAVFTAVFNILLSGWCLLGIYRAKTYRRSEYLIPFLLVKIVLALLFPMAMNDPTRPWFLLLLCLGFVIFEGLLVAIAVGAHWQYRRLVDPERLLPSEYRPLRPVPKESFS